MKSAVGGVLFIDEAYSLSGDQYGTEAIDTLVKEMEDKRDDLVVIVAGYPVPMEIFIAQNPGLASRFRTTIDFADYTDDELVGIFRKLAADADYDVSDDVEQHLRAMLAQVQRGPTFGNGRYSRNTPGEVPSGRTRGACGRSRIRTSTPFAPWSPQTFRPTALELDLAHPLVAQDGEQPEHSGTTPEEDEVQPS